MNKLMLICAALLLSACGSGGNGSDVGTGGGGAAPPPAPAPVMDMFYVRVNSLIGTAPDDAEPGDVSTVPVTDPEGTEPVGP